MSAPRTKPKRERYGDGPEAAAGAAGAMGSGSVPKAGSSTGWNRLGLAPGSTFGDWPGSPVGRPAGEGGGIRSLAMSPRRGCRSRAW